MQELDKNLSIKQMGQVHVIYSAVQALISSDYNKLSKICVAKVVPVVGHSNMYRVYYSTTAGQGQYDEVICMKDSLEMLLESMNRAIINLHK